MSKKTMNRRSFLKQAGLATGTAMIGLQTGLINPLYAQQEGNMSEAARKPWYDLGIIGDALMDERLLFYLGHTWYRMAEIGECLDTASRIAAGDSASWRAEWFRTADRVKAMGDASLQNGHGLSAGESYLRACSYYLAGLIYMESPADPEMPRTARASAETFEKALELLGMSGTPVNIPYENAVLPAYFFRALNTTEPAPILIAHEGMDASVEEMLFMAQEAVKRGYHCLLFHHPGQGLALREHNLTFRPDWENVITPVVDFAIAQPGVDAERIVLIGYSFGGALVTRAVAFEKRVKICVANPAVYNWWDFISSFLFGSYPELGDLLESDPDAFNVAIQNFLSQAPEFYTWWFNSAMWKFGGQSPADLLNKLKLYTNADIVDKVTCTMLVMDGEGETYAAGQAKQLYDALTCPKTYMLFTAEDTGLLHDQPGATAVACQRFFDWLDEHI